MTECKHCINSLPTLEACRKRSVDCQWPTDFECLMKMPDFSETYNCEWHVELNAGEAIWCNEVTNGRSKE